ncbi:MAG: hypothetical protein KJ847_05980, partial [Firmicutes bacterium]|nr:hypothetical protein [Bacillota bacterium]
DLNHLNNVLKKNSKIDTIAISSEPANVINLKEIIKLEITIKQFMDFIQKEIAQIDDNLIELTQEQISEIQDLANSKYNTWEWVFGQTPKFAVNKSGYHFEISKGIITESSHYDKYLLGVKFDPKIISEVLMEQADKDKIIEVLFK